MMTKAAAKRQALPNTEKLIAQYERHLLFDSGVDLAAATARDRFEAERAEGS
jgi:hypothetical protein